MVLSVWYWKINLILRCNLRSNPGGSDAAAVVTWQVALNQTEIFLGLLDFDVMSMTGATPFGGYF